ncbi:MAG: LacI family DNA-binding transcriptional regulator [Peptostreptococcaceae bacterium]
MLKQEDIAKLAGVSRATVSRVLNDDENVKTETREKILAIIEAYGYEKNYISSTLASKNEKVIYAFLLKSVVNHYSEEIKKGLLDFEKENKGFGYKIEIIQTSIENPESQIVELDAVLNNCSPSGIIITPLLKNEIMKRVLENERVKFLSLDNILSDSIPHIGANYYMGGQISGDIMRGVLRKNERVLVLKFPGDKVSVEEYYKGFTSSLQRESIRVVEAKKDILDSHNFLKEYLSEDIRGIFSNRYTLEIIKRNSELLTPENDYKIVGIAGNPEVNDYVKNEVIYASINEQFWEIGYTASKIMFETLYKNRKCIEHQFIKPVVAFKSLVK